jgi:hypothetical protein
LIGSCSNLHVNGWQCPSLGSFPAILQRKPILLCGSSFAIPKAEWCDTCPILLVPIEAPMRMFGRNPHHGGQLDRCGEHNANSHDEDKSKYLKYDQIVAVTDAVTIAPQQSAAQLHRNMQLAGPDSPGKNIAPELLRCMRQPCCAPIAGPIDYQATARVRHRQLIWFAYSICRRQVVQYAP